VKREFFRALARAFFSVEHVCLTVGVFAGSVFVQLLRDVHPLVSIGFAATLTLGVVSLNAAEEPRKVGRDGAS
jgi:hypothetical protein